MRIRSRILLGIGPILLVLPLAIAIFQYRVHMVESAWAEREEVTSLARTLAEMARVDDVTMAAFGATGGRAEVPPRIRTVLERRVPARIAGLRLEAQEVAFDSALSRPMPQQPAEVARIFETDTVAIVVGSDTWRAWAPVRDRDGTPRGIVVVETWSERAEVARQALVRGVLIVLVSGLIGVVVCFALGTFVTRHVTRLSIQNQGVEEGNLLGTRQLSRLQARSLPAPSPIQEVDDLGTAFDTMSSVLAEMVQKVRLSMTMRNPVAEDEGLMKAFEAIRPVTDFVESRHFRAYGRKVGAAAGHVLYLAADRERIHVVAYRIRGVSRVDGQVAAAAALECLGVSAPRALPEALDLVASLFPGSAGSAAECGASVRRWQLAAGRWETTEGSGTGPCVVHTFGGETARAIDLYVAVYGASAGSALADELAGLVRGRDEGVLAVLTPVEGAALVDEQEQHRKDR